MVTLWVSGYIPYLTCWWVCNQLRCNFKLSDMNNLTCRKIFVRYTGKINVLRDLWKAYATGPTSASKLYSFFYAFCQNEIRQRDDENANKFEWLITLLHLTNPSRKCNKSSPIFLMSVNFVPNVHTATILRRHHSETFFSFSFSIVKYQVESETKISDSQNVMNPTKMIPTAANARRELFLIYLEAVSV